MQKLPRHFSLYYILGFVAIIVAGIAGGMTTQSKSATVLHPVKTVSAQTKLPGFDIPASAAATVSATIATAPEQTTASPAATTKPLPAIHVPVLMYHYVRYMYNANDKLGYQLSVPPNIFEQQMAYLRVSGYTTISPQQLYEALVYHTPLPSKPVMLTFDDGYADFATEAMRVITEYNVKATEFIPTDLIGTPNYMTWDQVKAIAQNPNITVAGHTRHHANLVQTPLNQLDDEIAGGKNILEDHIGKPVDFFAYPYGAFNGPVVAAVKRAGYKEAFSTIEGRTDTINDLYSIRRVEIKGTYTSLAQFVALVGTQ